MRTSSIITISLPPAMAKASERAAKKQQMTRSELIRSALRRFLEELEASEAVRIYEEEKNAGKLITLKGSLADLVS